MQTPIAPQVLTSIHRFIPNTTNADPHSSILLITFSAVLPRTSLVSFALEECNDDEEGKVRHVRPHGASLMVETKGILRWLPRQLALLRNPGFLTLGSSRYSHP
jgi:hypothetical protein